MQTFHPAPQADRIAHLADHLTKAGIEFHRNADAIAAHGVTVDRDGDKLRLAFPDGDETTAPNSYGAFWQIVAQATEHMSESDADAYEQAVTRAIEVR